MKPNYTNRKTKFMLIVFGLMFLYKVSANISADIDFGTGLVIDTVLCKHHPDYSYAMYLPSGYNASLHWPVIYIFDPGARGALAVNVFKKGAEQYGYILICSNNSRNGDWQKIIEAVVNTIEDVGERFSLDTSRIYTAGFSGGSRVAAYIAQTTKKIAGVIGCGAGSPATNNQYEQLSYVYMGIVGNQDMNYQEMLKYEEVLTKKGVTAKLITFDAGHQWPDSMMIQEAVEWIELYAMRKGIKHPDNIFIRKLFEKQQEQIRLMENQNDLIEASRSLYYVLRDFSDQPDVVKCKQQKDSLEELKDYKKALKAWNKIRSEELSLQASFINALNNAAALEVIPDSISNWWKAEISKLKIQSKSKNQNNQYEALRLLNFLTGTCSASANEFVNKKSYLKAAVLLQINTYLQPENSNAYYALARVHALNKQQEPSLRILEKAVKLGFKNKAAVMKDPAFIFLKDNNHFKDILTRLQ
jgi:predicted esterase